MGKKEIMNIKDMNKLNFKKEKFSKTQLKDIKKIFNMTKHNRKLLRQLLFFIFNMRRNVNSILKMPAALKMYPMYTGSSNKILLSHIGKQAVNILTTKKTLKYREIIEQFLDFIII